MNAPLIIIPGHRPGTFTLGYRFVNGRSALVRDERFSPVLSAWEAEYLLRSEGFRSEVARRFQNNTQIAKRGTL